MSVQSILSKLRAWISVAPLLAAVFAPFSVLFDIPALTEPWFIHYDPDVLLDPNAANGVPDRPASIILSAIGLGFNVCANALLLVRFSTSARWWRVATRLSVGFWISKVVIAVLNLCIFGRLYSGTVRGEGFWCAVVSLIISGLITVLLLCHWAFDFARSRREKGSDSMQLAVRVAGRHFMLNVTLFVFDLGLLALIASQVEKWTYLQGIYFATETYLTIGFGDFYPTHTVTRVLLFFFAVVGIAQLGNIVGMLVEFFGLRSAERRAESRKEYERRRQEAEHCPDLGEEIDFLHHLGKRETARTRTIQLGNSLAGLLVFWAVSAAIFSHLEGWAYGTAVYFSYVSFLTVGYGDFTPITAAGRVVFVLYAFLAVPIVASLVVQAVQQIFSALSARQYTKVKAKWGLEPDIEKHHGKREAQQTKIVSHTELVQKWHREWEEHVRKHKAEGFSDAEARELADRDQEVLGHTDPDAESAEATGLERAREREFDEGARLTEQILEYALSLEWRARKLLITHLDTNEPGPARTTRIVLKADRNVQLREVKGMLKEIQDSQADEGDSGTDMSRPVLKDMRSATILRHILGDDPDVLDYPAETEEREAFDEIMRYREDFARLLAAGSRLMGLKGAERALFERRRLTQEE